MDTRHLLTLANQLAPLITSTRVQQAATARLLGVPLSVQRGDTPQSLADIREVLSSVTTQLSSVERDVQTIREGRLHYGFAQFGEAYRAETVDEMVSRIESAKDAFIYADNQERGHRRLQAKFCVGVCHTLLWNSRDAIHWYGDAYAFVLDRLEVLVDERLEIVTELIETLNRAADAAESGGFFGEMSMYYRVASFFLTHKSEIESIQSSTEDEDNTEVSHLREVQATLERLISAHAGETDPRIRQLYERNAQLEQTMEEHGEKVDAALSRYEEAFPERKSLH